MNRQYNVIGMHCAGCAARVEKKAGAVPGVTSAKVNLVAHCLTVSFDGPGNDQAVIAAVTSAGFQCEAMEQPKTDENRQVVLPEDQAILRRLLPSAALWLIIAIIMLWRMFHDGQAIPGAIELVLTLGIIHINRHIFINGFKRLFNGPDMDSLVAIGSTASFLLSAYTLAMLFLKPDGFHASFYFESSAMILVIVTFGKFLEAKAKSKAGSALEKLRELAPQNVTVVINDQEHEAKAGDVKPGDIIAVKPGGRIPMDGVVASGTSAIDESSLTGESMPRDVQPGNKVFAGTMNLTGAFRFRATQVGQDTLLAGIIKLVGQSITSKSKAIRLADKLAARFVPMVIALAVLTAAIWLIIGGSADFSLSMAISVLVVSCPCALGLATPVAVTVAMSRAAKSGILFKSGEALEKLKDIDTVFLDKTGTITTGKPEVTDIFPAGEQAALLALAASLETSSEHPLAKAVIKEAQKQGIDTQTVQDFVSVTGRGVKATIQNSLCAAGNGAFMTELSVVEPQEIKDAAQKLENEGKTVLRLAKDGRMIGIIAVRDTVAPNSLEAINAFKAMKLEVAMLSGDNPATAKAIAEQLGITNVNAGLLPADKEAVVHKAQLAGHKVAMAGDGINDAPALASSDAAIAMGTGTDIAIDCADIVVMGPNLLDAAYAIKLARATIVNIRQNLFWAFFYNILAIPVAAGCLSRWGITLNPMIAAAAMSLSSICVVTNALRLGK